MCIRPSATITYAPMQPVLRSTVVLMVHALQDQLLLLLSPLRPPVQVQVQIRLVPLSKPHPALTSKAKATRAKAVSRRTGLHSKRPAVTPVAKNNPSSKAGVMDHHRNQRHHRRHQPQPLHRHPSHLNLNPRRLHRFRFHLPLCLSSLPFGQNVLRALNYCMTVVTGGQDLRGGD